MGLNLLGSSRIAVAEVGDRAVGVAFAQVGLATTEKGERVCPLVLDRLVEVRDSARDLLFLVSYVRCSAQKANTGSIFSAAYRHCKRLICAVQVTRHTAAANYD